MKKDKIFTKSSVMNIAAADIFDWHAGVGAIEWYLRPSFFDVSK